MALGRRLGMHAKRFGAKRLGLDLCEWRILQVLGTHKQSIIVDLADDLGVDRGGTSNAVSRLVDRGIVVREEDPNDRRRISVTLTKEGWRLFDQIAAFAQKREAHLLSCLSEKQRDQLVESLALLVVEAGEMISEEWVPASATK